jgi:hypothetical protein
MSLAGHSLIFSWDAGPKSRCVLIISSSGQQKELLRVLLWMKAIIMSLVSQIEDNVVTDLRLSDTDHAILDNIPQFLNSLEKNTTIESMFFDGKFFGCLR